MSSLIASVSVKDLPHAKPTLKRGIIIDSMDNFQNWYVYGANTDPNLDIAQFIPFKGKAGEEGFTVNPEVYGGGDIEFDYGTRKVTDPQWRGAGQGALLIDVLSSRMPEKMEIKVIELVGITDVEYAACPTFLEPNNGWITIRVETNQFKSIEGEVLSRWDQVDLIRLCGTALPSTPPVFRRLRWESLPVVHGE